MAQATETKGKAKDPQDTFKRLANYRMTQTLDALRRVKNTARYPHTPEQARRIKAALEDAVGATLTAFDQPAKSSVTPTFSVDADEVVDKAE